MIQQLNQWREQRKMSLGRTRNRRFASMIICAVCKERGPNLGSPFTRALQSPRVAIHPLSCPYYRDTPRSMMHTCAKSERYMDDMAGGSVEEKSCIEYKSLFALHATRWIPVMPWERNITPLFFVYPPCGPVVRPIYPKQWHNECFCRLQTPPSGWVNKSWC